MKEFKIKDILEAVENISNIKKKVEKNDEKKIISNKKDVLSLNNQVKSSKSDILVLDEMIEQNIKDLKEIFNDYSV